jgi:TfoX/Sxy family transcriptional regulator of competence genes
MGFKKVPPENVEMFRAALPAAPDVAIKKMFGCEAGFVNGNMFCGTFEDTMIVRLDESGRAAAQKAGFQPFVPMGKPMREYVSVPADKIGDKAFLRRWFTKGLAYAAGLPVKKAKKKLKGG